MKRTPNMIQTYNAAERVDDSICTDVSDDDDLFEYMNVNKSALGMWTMGCPQCPNSLLEGKNT